MSLLNFTSININGLNPAKANRFFQYLLTKHFDIIFIQETHIHSMKQVENMRSFSNHFDMYWSFGTNFARGVATLVRKNLNSIVNNFHHDFFGRLLYIDISINNNSFRMINVYCPNNPRERKDFISDLDQCLSVNKLIVLAGDFNCVENTQLDKNDPDSPYGTVGAAEISSLNHNFNLV